MFITDLLNEDGILLSASVANKEEAINMLISGPHRFGVLADAATCHADVLVRESQGTTALPGGIAIPHAKSRGVASLGVNVLTVPGGVDFGATDGSKSRLVFLLVGPEHDPSGYLDMLSSLLKLFTKNDQLADRLVAAKTSGEFLSILREAEGR